MQAPSENTIKKQLNEVLTQVAQSQNIKNFVVTSDTGPSFGDGMVADFFKGEVKNKDTGEFINVAIKKAPTFDMGFKALFSNEILFYETAYSAMDHLQKETKVLKPFDNLPTYYCGSLESKKEYLAMEDLTHLGFKMCDKMKCFDKEHLEMLFKVYGKFHALSYVLRLRDSEKFESITNNFADLFQFMAAAMDKPMRFAISAAVNSLDPEKDKIVLDEVKDFGDHALKVYLEKGVYNGKDKVLIHGDCWSNNILFKYSETGALLDLKIIDFQQSRINSPVHDLSYLFYSGASKKDFDKLDDYLQIYYDSFSGFATELGASPDDIFSLEELKNDWKEYAIWGVVVAIYLYQLKLTPKEELAKMRSGMGDSFQNLMQNPDNLKNFPELQNLLQNPEILQSLQNPQNLQNMENLPNIPDLQTIMQSLQKFQALVFEESMKKFAACLQELHKSDLYRQRTSDILRAAFEYGVINKNKILINKE